MTGAAQQGRPLSLHLPRAGVTVADRMGGVARLLARRTGGRATRAAIVGTARAATRQVVRTSADRAAGVGATTVASLTDAAGAPGVGTGRFGSLRRARACCRTSTADPQGTGSRVGGYRHEDERPVREGVAGRQNQGAVLVGDVADASPDRHPGAGLDAGDDAVRLLQDGLGAAGPGQGRSTPAGGAVPASMCSARRRAASWSES